MFFGKSTNRSTGIYIDMEYGLAGSTEDRRSTTGCLEKLSNMEKKQSMVARSIAEAEFRAIAHGIYEGF